MLITKRPDLSGLLASFPLAVSSQPTTMLIENVLDLNYLTDRNRRIKLYGYGGNVLVVGCGDTANGGAIWVGKSRC